MKYSAIFSHASRLRESGNRFILAELEKVGLSDIAPSHGDILVRLLACEACNMSELAKQVHRHHGKDIQDFFKENPTRITAFENFRADRTIS